MTGLEIIFLTGDTLRAEITRFLEAVGAPSVSKPFALEEVRRAVQSALARAGTGPPDRTRLDEPGLREGRGTAPGCPGE